MAQSTPIRCFVCGEICGRFWPAQIQGDPEHCYEGHIEGQCEDFGEPDNNEEFCCSQDCLDAYIEENTEPIEDDDNEEVEE